MNNSKDSFKMLFDIIEENIDGVNKAEWPINPVSTTFFLGSEAIPIEIFYKIDILICL